MGRPDGWIASPGSGAPDQHHLLADNADTTSYNDGRKAPDARSHPPVSRHPGLPCRTPPSSSAPLHSSANILPSSCLLVKAVCHRTFLTSPKRTLSWSFNTILGKFGQNFCPLLCLMDSYAGC